RPVPAGPPQIVESTRLVYRYGITLVRWQTDQFSKSTVLRTTRTRSGFAHVVAAGTTWTAGTTRDHRTDSDRGAYGKVCCLGVDRFDDAGEFMTLHEGQLGEIVIIPDRKICAT